MTGKGWGEKKESSRLDDGGHVQKDRDAGV